MRERSFQKKLTLDQLVLTGRDPNPEVILLEDVSPENWWLPLVVAAVSLIGLAVVCPLALTAASKIYREVQPALTTGNFFRNSIEFENDN